jgi:hypothetical protein
MRHGGGRALRYPFSRAPGGASARTRASCPTGRVGERINATRARIADHAPIKDRPSERSKCGAFARRRLKWR